MWQYMTAVVTSAPPRHPKRAAGSDLAGETVFSAPIITPPAAAALPQHGKLFNTDPAIFDHLPPREQARILRALRVEFVMHPGFKNPAEIERQSNSLSAGGRSGIMTREQEHAAFFMLNFRKYEVAQKIKSLNESNVTARDLRGIHLGLAEVKRLRDMVFRRNEPLVLAMFKRFNRSVGRLEPADYLEAGQGGLLNAIEKYDLLRGFRFSSYACRAILKAFCRRATEEARWDARECQLEDSFASVLPDRREASNWLGMDQALVERRLKDCIASLAPAERAVIEARFAPSPVTLEQVGEQVGVSKERVRQIQNKAIRKLRTVMTTLFGRDFGMDK